MHTIASRIPLLLALTACGGQSGETFSATPCQASRAQLQPQQAGSNGLTGEDVLALAADTFREVQVTWEGDSHPGQDVFTFDFGEPLAFHDVEQFGDPAWCQGRQWVEVDVPVTIASDSGWIAGSDLVHLVAVDADTVRMMYTPGTESRMDVTVDGPYLDAALDVKEGVFHTSFGVSIPDLEKGPELTQSVAITAHYANDDSGGTATVFSCRGDCFQLADPES